MPAPNQINETQRSIVSELDPNKEINKIAEQLLGIYTILSEDSNKRSLKTVRQSRPFFSEEFISNLKYLLFSYLNNVNAYSKYDADSIARRTKNISHEIVDLLASHGNDEFISQKTWLKILKIHDSGDGIMGNIKETKISGWQKFGIQWTYDSAVTNEMVSYVKDMDEEEDQSIIFEFTHGAIRRMIESVFRRSLDMPDNYGMMLSVVNQTRNESYNASAQQQLSAPMPLMGGQQ